MDKNNKYRVSIALRIDKTCRLLCSEKYIATFFPKEEATSFNIVNGLIKSDGKSLCVFTKVSYYINTVVQSIFYTCNSL